MKKYLSLALVAVMLVAAFTVAAFAEAPKAADFTANNGFFIYDGKQNKTDVQDPATMADTDKGLQIIHGGYYSSGDNCGGVVSNEKYDLNGFEATVYFEKAPVVKTDTDCWVAMDFLAAPRAFYTNNFNVENGGNQGILNLIRFGRPYFEAYDGITGFGQKYNSQGEDAAVNAIFSIVSGTTITVRVDRTEIGTYKLTFTNGSNSFTVPWEWDLTDVAPDGKAHFSVIASCEIAPEDGWTYYITDLKNGTEMTAEEIEAIAAAKAEAERAEKAAEAKKETERAAEKVAEARERAEACGSEDALKKVADGEAAIADSYAAIEEADFEYAQQMSDYARDCAKEANDASKIAEKANETANTDEPVEDPTDEPVEDPTDEPVEDPTDEPANATNNDPVNQSNVEDSKDVEESGSQKKSDDNTVLYIAIVIAVVVVVAVVAVVVLKKKKQ